MLIGVNGIIPVPWDRFDPQYRILAPINTYPAAGTFTSPAARILAERMLLIHVIGEVSAPAGSSFIDTKIEQSFDGIGDWELIYTFSTFDKISIPYSVVHKTKPFIRSVTTTAKICSVAIVAAFELTMDARGIAPTYLQQYDIRPYTLRNPTAIPAIANFAAPALKLYSPGKVQVIQFNYERVVGSNQQGRIEQSHDGSTNWTTIHTFPLMTTEYAISALVNVTEPFIRHVTTTTGTMIGIGAIVLY